MVFNFFLSHSVPHRVRPVCYDDFTCVQFKPRQKSRYKSGWFFNVRLAVDWWSWGCWCVTDRGCLMLWAVLCVYACVCKLSPHREFVPYTSIFCAKDKLTFCPPSVEMSLTQSDILCALSPSILCEKGVCVPCSSLLSPASFQIHTIKFYFKPTAWLNRLAL